MRKNLTPTPKYDRYGVKKTSSTFFDQNHRKSEAELKQEAIKDLTEKKSREHASGKFMKRNGSTQMSNYYDLKENFGSRKKIPKN